MPKLHPDWRMLAGAGGWFIPGPDYLAFLDIFDPAHPFLGDTVKAWIDRAQTSWTPANNDRWYGLGVNAWAGAGRWAVSHGGILQFARQGCRRPADGRLGRQPRVPGGRRHRGVHRAETGRRKPQESLDELRGR